MTRRRHRVQRTDISVQALAKPHERCKVSLRIRPRRRFRFRGNSQTSQYISLACLFTVEFKAEHRETGILKTIVHNVKRGHFFADKQNLLAIENELRDEIRDRL